MPPSIWSSTDEWEPELLSVLGDHSPSIDQFADSIYRAASGGSRHPRLEIEGSSITDIAEKFMEKIRAAAMNDNFTELLVSGRRFDM